MWISPFFFDEREDKFDPSYLPSGDSTIVTGDFNAHHPLWDVVCGEADEVVERIANWLDSIGWTTFNDGRPTFTSYRSGGQTASDAAFCNLSLAWQTKRSIGPHLGSDHLPMLLEIRTGDAPPKRIRKRAGSTYVRMMAKVAALPPRTPSECSPWLHPSGPHAGHRVAPGGPGGPAGAAGRAAGGAPATGATTTVDAHRQDHIQPGHRRTARRCGQLHEERRNAPSPCVHDAMRDVGVDRRLVERRNPPRWGWLPQHRS